jgi:plasmid rolling circle replication initiator protein Rep
MDSNKGLEKVQGKRELSAKEMITATMYHLARALDNITSSEGYEEEYAEEEVYTEAMPVVKPYMFDDEKRKRLRKKKKRKKPGNISADKFDPNKKEHGDYRERKMNALKLHEALEEMGHGKRANRAKMCNTYLLFKHEKENQPKLVKTFRCKERLCHSCMYELSRKVALNVHKCMGYLNETKKADYVFLTLTQKNVEGEQLNDEISNVLGAWKKIMDMRQFSGAVEGFVRALEVTHDVETHITEERYNERNRYGHYTRRAYYKKLGIKVGDPNPQYNMYHTHVHVILHVNRLYFTNSKIYTSRKKWAEMWRRALGADYTPVVDVRLFKPSAGHGTFELAKYVVKPEEFVFQSKEEQIETIRTLCGALHKRVLVSFAGSFRKARKALNLQDEEKDEADEGENEKGKFVEMSEWWWHFAYKQYKRKVVPE